MDKTLHVLRILEKLSEKQFIPSIGPIKGKIIEGEIKKHLPKKILEIGALFGYSAILMARLLPRDGKVVTIEIDPKYADIARKNIEYANLSNKIKVIVGDALEVIPKLKEKFDFLFIDAAKEEYLNYLKLAEKNLKKGSIVIADNVGIFAYHLQDYLNYVRNSGKYKSKTIEVPLEFFKNIKDAMEISVKLF
ncbi:MAG: O-methyltransferase [Candidatus Aenigmatarchaeota archaeon]